MAGGMHYEEFAPNVIERLEKLECFAKKVDGFLFEDKPGKPALASIAYAIHRHVMYWCGVAATARRIVRSLARWLKMIAVILGSVVAIGAALVAIGHFFGLNVAIAQVAGHAVSATGATGILDFGEKTFLFVFFALYFAVPVVAVWMTYSDFFKLDLRALWMQNDRPDKLAVIILGTWWVHTCSMILWTLLKTISTADYATYMGWAIPIIMKMFAPQRDQQPPEKP